MINPLYLEPDGPVCKGLGEAFRKRLPYKCSVSGAEIVAKVYPTVVLPSFIDSTSTFESIFEALNTKVRYEEKRADLYRFYQSIGVLTP